MTTKSIQCREHGGTFEIEARRGRPPVRCSDENPCTRAPRAASKRRVAEALGIPEVQAKVKSLTLAEWRKAAKDAGFSAGVINKMRTPAMFRELLGSEAATGKRSEPDFHPVDPAPTRQRTAARKAVKSKLEPVEEAMARVRQEAARKAAQEAPEADVRVNPSIPKAHAAKAQLEPLGWKVNGTHRFEGEDGHARITATRGEELIIIAWKNGLVSAQEYILWNTEKPSKNNVPEHKLPFDPDEMTDNELVRAMSGMKVTWWNRIAGGTEDAIVSKDKVKIEHLYNGGGDEMPGDRVVSFVDYGGSGFRAFRVGALLKIG